MKITRQPIAKNALVMGLGKTGKSVINFFLDMGIKTVGYDRDPDCSLSGVPKDVDIILGQCPDVAAFDLVVPSPGIPSKEYAKARRALGDIELAFRELDIPIIAVTGTNGKSTTVKMITDLLHSLGHRAMAAGNFGVPALDLLNEELDFAVLEISSFQLETVELFRPHVGILLNLSEDHLDRHGTFQNYVRTKGRMFSRQTQSDVAITSEDNKLCDNLARRGKALQLRFRTKERNFVTTPPCTYVEDQIVKVIGNDFEDEFQISGKITEAVPPENFLASALALESLGLSSRDAFRNLKNFEPLPHRRTTLRLPNEISIIDDSKATNPAAAKAALKLTPGPIVWLAGGRDKGASFLDLANVAQVRAREAVLYGEAANRIAAALDKRIEYVIVEKFETAVALAYSKARHGDSILLAPACSSFDQFQSFEHRGECFQRIAKAVAANR